MQRNRKIGYIQSGRTKEKKLSLGIHVRKVSEIGKVPSCQYCRGNIKKNRGEWHMVKVAENTTNQQWGKNELHFHFKCAKQGLEESKRAMDQLLSIVRSENDIGLVKNGQLSYL
jgi:hypothetical protein